MTAGLGRLVLRGSSPVQDALGPSPRFAMSRICHDGCDGPAWYSGRFAFASRGIALFRAERVSETFTLLSKPIRAAEQATELKLRHCHDIEPPPGPEIGVGNLYTSQQAHDEPPSKLPSSSYGIVATSSRQQSQKSVSEIFTPTALARSGSQQHC